MFRRLKNKFLFEKENLNRVRFNFNYIYAPIIYGVMFIDFLVCFLLLLSRKNQTIPIVITMVVALGCVVFYLVLSSKTKKVEIHDETESIKYFFGLKLEKKPECKYVLPNAEDGSNVELFFTDKGIKVNKLEYSYDGFECALFTSNFLRHVCLVIVFARTKQGDMEDGDANGVMQFSLPLDLNLLSIMSKFDIKLKNPDVLRFIKDNPRESAIQILKYGKIQEDYDKIEAKIKEQKIEEDKKEKASEPEEKKLADDKVENIEEEKTENEEELNNNVEEKTKKTKEETKK